MNTVKCTFRLCHLIDFIFFLSLLLSLQSSVQPMQVANMIFYPGEEYGIYDQEMSQYNNIYPNGNFNNRYGNNNNYNYNNNNNNNNPNNQPNSAVMAGPSANAESAVVGFPFSFRPLIDSIFEVSPPIGVEIQ